MRAITLSVLVLLTACGNTDRPLRDMRAAGGGPDEFQVIPVGPLTTPETLTLPEPTPGGTNRTDPQPNADAIAALGGNANAQIAGGVPSGDSALVNQSSRYGVDPAIRSQLATEDAQLRDRKRRSNLFNPLNRDRYFPAYAGQALDASAELERLRALGIAVPTPVRAQPQSRPQVEPEQSAPETEDEQPRFLQRTLDDFIERVWDPTEDSNGVPQNCVFKTVPPDNRLRRVCTPITDEDQ